jgi:hypothetical protein
MCCRTRQGRNDAALLSFSFSGADILLRNDATCTGSVPAASDTFSSLHCRTCYQYTWAMDKRCKVVGIACMWPFFIAYLALVGTILWNPGIWRLRCMLECGRRRGGGYVDFLDLVPVERDVCLPPSEPSSSKVLSRLGRLARRRRWRSVAREQAMGRRPALMRLSTYRRQSRCTTTSRRLLVARHVIPPFIHSDEVVVSYRT